MSIVVIQCVSMRCIGMYNYTDVQALCVLRNTAFTTTIKDGIATSYLIIRANIIVYH